MDGWLVRFNLGYVRCATRPERSIGRPRDRPVGLLTRRSRQHPIDRLTHGSIRSMDSGLGRLCVLLWCSPAAAGVHVDLKLEIDRVPDLKLECDRSRCQMVAPQKRPDLCHNGTRVFSNGRLDVWFRCRSIRDTRTWSIGGRVDSEREIRHVRFTIGSARARLSARIGQLVCTAHDSSRFYFGPSSSSHVLWPLAAVGRPMVWEATTGELLWNGRPMMMIHPGRENDYSCAYTLCFYLSRLLAGLKRAPLRVEWTNRPQHPD